MKLKKRHNANKHTSHPASTKSGTKEKKKMRREIDESAVDEFDDDSTDNSVKKGTRGPLFSPKEDSFIANNALAISEENGIVELPDLAKIAKRVNMKFHDGNAQRSDESLWWRIKRQKLAGNEKFAEIMIRGGSPKKVGPSNQVRGSVERALKPAIPSRARLPAQPQRRAPAVRPATPKKGAAQGIEILAKDANGSVTRITTKFESIDELLFAVS